MPRRSRRPAPSAPDRLSALHAAKDDNPEVTEMRRNRRINSKTAGARGSLSLATMRPREPMRYWEEANQPWDVLKDPKLLPKVREFCYRLYMSHPVIGSAIDIFSKFPLTGMELTCKDEALQKFYEELFFTQLDYDEFLIDFGREYWTAGEAWPLGSFNESLGVWEDDELLHPDDCEPHRSPFRRSSDENLWFTIRLPQPIRELLQTREPRFEYERLLRALPDVGRYTNTDKPLMPVSNILLQFHRFKGFQHSTRGVPLLMRAMRSVLQEEMLNAAQDAIADRLYTPLLLAKLGATATDLGLDTPWIPTADEIADFEEQMDAALAADFRLMTTHFGVDLSSVFGREVMPNFDADFDRLTERILQTFGLSKTMLSGAGQGETYAADALNRDLISQLLTVYQKRVKRFFLRRALVVAEAQEHYDYRTKGGQRYPIMEEVLEVDEETGQERIVEQPKLLVPDLQIAVMNMQDDTTMRQLLEALRSVGVPISMKTRLTNLPIELREEMETSKQEQVDLAVAQQETRRETYLALLAANLPIPQDLVADFQAVPVQVSPIVGTDPARLPTQGIDDTTVPALAPTFEELSMPPGVPGSGEAGAQVLQLPRNQIMNRPAESDEQRAGMPKPATLYGTPAHVGRRQEVGPKADEPLEEADGAG